MRQMKRRKPVKAAKTALEIGLLAVSVCLLFCLFAKGVSAVKRRNWDGSSSARLAAFIWKEWYPAKGDSAEAEVEEDVSLKNGWLIQFILRQVPYYNMAENEGSDWSAMVDPAYSDYAKSGRILKEYEYLVKGLSGSTILSSGNNPLAQGNPSDNGSEHKLSGEQQEEAGKAESSSLAVTGTKYIEEQLADYDFLMKHFYTVHPTAAAGRDMIKAETFLSEDFALTAGNDAPQILIYHTHSQEEFADYADGNKEATIVGVGNYLTELLRAKGYNVIHDTSVYDLRDGKLDRSKAYTYALDGITGILQKNPSIQVVLDIHRDGVKEGTHLVQQINGKDTATVMFFNGTSQTPTGPIEYLKNQYRTDNLAFSFQMKLCAEAYYPGFTRRIYLKGLRYNMHLRPRSALVEVGAQTNTYAEARNAMEPLSELLDMVLRPRTDDR